MTTNWTSPVCVCGRLLELERNDRAAVDLACLCERRIEVRRAGGSWLIAAMLAPERSVPISGFSRELRLDPRAQRFYFSHSIGGSEIPVHIVYSESLRVAEVKAAGMKVSALVEVDGPLDARRRWVERFEALRRHSKPGPNRRPSDSFPWSGPRPAARPS